jgi:hypothetical protein
MHGEDGPVSAQVSTDKGKAGKGSGLTRVCLERIQALTTSIVIGRAAVKL